MTFHLEWSFHICFCVFHANGLFHFRVLLSLGYQESYTKDGEHVDEGTCTALNNR